MHLYMLVYIGTISIHLNIFTPGNSYILTIQANVVLINIVNSPTKKTIMSELVTYSCSKYIFICIQTSVDGLKRFMNINKIGNKNISVNTRTNKLLNTSSLCGIENYFHLATSNTLPALSFSIPRLVRFIESILNGYPQDLTISDTSIFCLIGYS